MGRSLKQIFVLLGIATLLMLAVALTLPLSAVARPQAAQVLPGIDLALSGVGGRLPEIAANGEFVAVVFEQSSRAYIRAVQQGSGWGSTTALDSNQGATSTALSCATAKASGKR